MWKLTWKCFFVILPKQCWTLPFLTLALFLSSTNKTNIHSVCDDLRKEMGVSSCKIFELVIKKSMLLLIPKQKSLNYPDIVHVDGTMLIFLIKLYQHFLALWQRQVIENACHHYQKFGFFKT